jgi:hypothetical protein
MIVEGTATAYSRHLMNQLSVNMAQRHANDYRQPIVRLGDFEGRNTHGSMHDVKCLRCGLSGTISIPEADITRRSTCPRCHHIPEIEWQSRGQAALLPPEQLKPAIRQIVTADAEDDVIEDAASSDEPSELSTEALIAQADASVIETELEGVNPEEETSTEEEPTADVSDAD